MKSRRIIAMLLCTMLVFSLLPAAVFADEAEEEIIDISFDREESAEGAENPNGEEVFEEDFVLDEDEIPGFEDSDAEAAEEADDAPDAEETSDGELPGQPETEEDGNEFAADIMYEGMCGENLAWKLYTTGELFISGSGSMSDWAFRDYTAYIKSVVISGASSIGNFSLCDCPELKSVTISDTVTSIGDYAFSSCEALTDITIPSGVTSIGKYAFHDCKSLKCLTVPGSVTKIEEGAFRFCTSLTDVKILNGVKRIGSIAFEYCGLTAITIPSGVEEIGDEVFYSCNSLSKIKFEGNAPAFDDDAFLGVKTTVYYPGDNSTWTSAVQHNYNGDITWKPYVLNGKCGDNLFWELKNSGELYIWGSGPMWEFTYDKIPWEALRDDILSIKIEGAASIGMNAFAYAKNAASVSIPESVVSIGAFAFMDCRSLSSVELPGGITEIPDYAFNKCAKLSNVGIPEGVKTIRDDAFSECSSLESIAIPASVESIQMRAFDECTKLKEINVASGNRSYSSAGGVLFSADGKTLYEFPQAKSGEYIIPAGVEKIEMSAFSNCSGVTAVTVPKTVKLIGGDALSNCCSLKEVEFLGNAPEITGNAFRADVITAYYPYGNASWNAIVSANEQYFGTISWKSRIIKTEPKITAVANHADYMIVNWGKVECAVSYKLACREGGAWSFMDVPLYMVDGQGNPRVNLKNLKQGAAYTFIVYANFEDGTQTKSPSATQMRLITPAVKAKAGVGYVNLTWNGVEGGSQYKIYYREKGGSWQLYAYVGKNVTSVNIKESVINANGWQPLTKGKTYEFVVLTATSVPGITSGFPTNPATVVY